MASSPQGSSSGATPWALTPVPDLANPNSPAHEPNPSPNPEPEPERVPGSGARKGDGEGDGRAMGDGNGGMGTAQGTGSGAGSGNILVFKVCYASRNDPWGIEEGFVFNPHEQGKPIFTVARSLAKDNGVLVADIALMLGEQVLNLGQPVSTIPPNSVLNAVIRARLPENSKAGENFFCRQLYDQIVAESDPVVIQHLVAMYFDLEADDAVEPAGPNATILQADPARIDMWRGIAPEASGDSEAPVPPPPNFSNDGQHGMAPKAILQDVAPGIAISPEHQDPSDPF